MVLAPNTFAPAHNMPSSPIAQSASASGLVTSMRRSTSAVYVPSCSSKQYSLPSVVEADALEVAAAVARMHSVAAHHAVHAVLADHWAERMQHVAAAKLVAVLLDRHGMPRRHHRDDA